MSWYKIFYWLSVADNVKMATGWISIVLGVYMVGAVVSALGAFDYSFSKWDAGSKRVFYIFSMSFFLNILMWTLLPSKKDSLLILAGGGALTFLTTDSSAKRLPAELTTFVVGELKSMAKDTEVQLEVLNQKDKLLDEAKQMTTTELLEKMKVDTNFAKIILNN